MSSRSRAIFVCGDQSPYGRAHLAPVLDCFEIAGIITADPARWAIFREKLSGIPHQPATGMQAWLNSIRKQWRKRRPGYIDVPAVIRLAGISWLETHDVNDAATRAWIRERSPDVILSAAYPQIFATELLTAAPRGAINFHPSLLPRFRGAHPHFWAVATGAETTGVTAHFMTPRIDDGDIVAQREFPIADLTYSQVYRRINQETPALVRDVAEFLVNPVRSPKPQDHGSATFFRNDRDVHRRIFWRLHGAVQVRNLCRTERAFCFFRGQSLTPLGATILTSNRNLTNGVHVESGTIVDLNGGQLVIKASDGCIAIREIQLGRCKLSADRWAARLHLQIGEHLD